MKKIAYSSLALLLFGLLVFSSCDKIKDLAKVNFNLENADAAFVIPIIPATGSVSMDAPTVYLNLDSIIKAQNAEIGSNNIKEVHIKSCELVLSNGDEANNFSALESCSLEVASNKNTEFVSISSVDNNPDITAQSLNLNANETLDLKDYFLNATQFSYRIAAKARKTTNKELQCKAIVKYTIVAGL